MSMRFPEYIMQSVCYISSVQRLMCVSAQRCTGYKDELTNPLTEQCETVHMKQDGLRLILDKEIFGVSRVQHNGDIWPLTSWDWSVSKHIKYRININTVQEFTVWFCVVISGKTVSSYGCLENSEHSLKLYIAFQHHWPTLTFKVLHNKVWTSCS